jgi:MFS family permease
VVRQSVAAACQALGVGLVSSMLVVWFHLRFGVGADAIGPILTASYLLSAISFFPATAIARRIGSVRAIVATRVIAAGLVLLMALSPTFFIAAVFQVARQVFSQMITPVRQSFTMGLVSSEERASVSGLTGLVRRLSAAASPLVSGVLMDAGDLALPLFGSAGLQLISAALYFRFFDRMDDRPGSAVVLEVAPSRQSPILTEERR